MHLVLGTMEGYACILLCHELISCILQWGLKMLWLYRIPPGSTLI